MADQMIFLGLNGTTSSKIIVRSPRRKLGQHTRTTASQAAIFLETSRAAHRLRGGPLDRLAELREAAAKRVRTMPDYPDPEHERAENAGTTAAFEGLQAETDAWNAGE